MSGLIEMFIKRPIQGLRRLKLEHLKKMTDMGWWGDRYIELKFGHGYYFMFPIIMINFTLISHRMFVKPFVVLFRHQFPILNLFYDIKLYSLILPLIYVPVSMYVGHLHKTKQLRRTQKVSYKASPAARDLGTIMEKIDALEEKLNRLLEERGDA